MNNTILQSDVFSDQKLQCFTDGIGIRQRENFA